MGAHRHSLGPGLFGIMSRAHFGAQAACGVGAEGLQIRPAEARKLGSSSM